jgi:hypothetical protein
MWKVMTLLQILALFLFFYRDGLDDQGVGVRFPVEERDLSLLHNIQTYPRAYLASWVPGGSFTGVKRLGREADHSHPSSACLRMVKLYLHSPICLHVVIQGELDLTFT